VVTRFVEAARNRDFAAIGDCFTEDSTVADEEQTHRDRSEIRSWQEASRRKWDYTFTAKSGSARGADGYVIEGHLTGNFPGGEADVTYTFTLREGLISRLVIS
jgi:ketosteroid isomerase-like protein